MKLKEIIHIGLLVTWMIVIFIFSNQNGNTSQNTSDKVSTSIVNTIEIITNNEIPAKKKNDFVVNNRFVIRKFAHFTLYFILGILVYLVFIDFNISKSVIYSIVFCLLYAISDEVHQMFSIGRTAKAFDVFIDTLGSIVGSYFCLLFHKRIKKILKKERNYLGR